MNKKRNGYFGFDASSEFLQMTWGEFTNYIRGELIISIGRGDFKSRVLVAIRMAAAWGIYHDNGV